MNSAASVPTEQGIIVKKAKYQNLEAQIHVYQRVRDLSKTCDLFVTPEVVGYDLQADSIKFKCLPAFESLAEYLETANHERHVIEKAARSLAYVHQRGRLDPEFIRYAPGTWRGCSNDCVLIHGDFNLVNVGYDSRQDRIVILDWEVTPALNIYFNMGSRYLDIACFLRNLLLQQQSLCQGVMEFSQRATWFLDTYQHSSGVELSLGTLWYYLNILGQASGKKQWAQHKWLSLGQNMSGKMMLSYFIKMYKTHSLEIPNDGKGNAQCK